MATLALSTVGSIVAGGTGGLLGAITGNYIDRQIFGINKFSEANSIQNTANITIQGATYSKKIPLVFGSMKLAGNIIWALPVKKVPVVENTEGINLFKPRNNFTGVEYMYYATLAIGLCEGEVDSVVRMWANDSPIDMDKINIKIYKGTEEQDPDSTMHSLDKATPAYRGLCYVVITEFPLASYNNQLPTFTFEVSCVKKISKGDNSLDLIKAVNIGPGFGEFSYDTVVQNKISVYQYFDQYHKKGGFTPINSNSNTSKADALLSLDNLSNNFSKLEWISVAIAWFASSVNCGSCSIYPTVEYRDGFTTSPSKWLVAGITRKNARLAFSNSKGELIYGGTVSDKSLISLLEEIRRRGYKIMLNPMIYVEDLQGQGSNKITGSSASVADFFSDNSDYVRFIIHYATITKDKIDCFSIGSSLKGLTSVCDGAKYPGVEGLIKLANNVKNLLGHNVYITYAAGWDEYNSSELDWSMDSLWASDSIDFVGINAYFPLTEKSQSEIGYNIDTIVNGWNSGEGYDYYYADSARKTKQIKYNKKLSAWKNIELWWQSSHQRSDGSNSLWVPKLKKIWFTAYGFSSMDACASQPYVFYNKNNTSPNLPLESWGNVDFQAQYSAIFGTVKRWATSSVVDHMFLWYWDVRPYPFFPALYNVWDDTENWMLSHSIQGKIGSLTLNSIVQYLFKRSGIKVDTLGLADYVHGLIINSEITLGEIIDALRFFYFFDIAQRQDGSVVATSNLTPRHFIISNNDLLWLQDKNVLSIRRVGYSSLPKSIMLNYFSSINNYATITTNAKLDDASSTIKHTKNLTVLMPVALIDAYANSMAEAILEKIWVERNIYLLKLPLQYCYLSIGDVIEFMAGNDKYVLRIVDIRQGSSLRIQAVQHVKQTLYGWAAEVINVNYKSSASIGTPSLIFTVVDLPNVSGIGGLTMAVCSESKDWSGAIVYVARGKDSSFEQLANIETPTTMGFTVNKLGDPDSVCTIDNINSLLVTLHYGLLESVDIDEFLDGANTALVGDEIIQFQSVELLAEDTYKLTNLLRGRLGTEDCVTKHMVNDRFILLDKNAVFFAMNKKDIGSEFIFKTLAIDQMAANSAHTTSLQDINAHNVLKLTYVANALKPYSVVNISSKKNSDKSIDISWVRRCRVNGELRDFVDVALDEDYERYDVDIIKDNTVKRTMQIDVLHNTIKQKTIQMADEKTLDGSCYLKYTYEQQIADFGAEISSLHLSVYQMSSLVGRGLVTNKIIQVPK
ncbi:putative Host specificity protein [Candidatus Xenohaliotis californiensis]|uniref:Host specificity protein n=1 Tax=Candidatus Xenohaliotis californiensis TaxID=84677 RepID=A0ABM9N986_9RICK|nr:putative Host specificity protein [Candidatus Xenohaliotis californiensis]